MDLLLSFLKNKGIYILTFILLAVFTSSQHKSDSEFDRPIQGDVKAYYAYLPALFIYQDKTYGFVDEMESKYYPSDGSAFKDFTNKQPNGTVVNKTFPGLAIAYLPFFAGAYCYAALAEYPLDGYSLPFQTSIVIAHWVFILLGLVMLQRASAFLNCRKRWFWIVSLSLIFGTNIHYYLIYDFSVSHICNFLLSSAFVLNIFKWIQQSKLKFLGIALLILAFSIIVRPTNAIFFIFIPFLSLLLQKNLLEVIKQTNFKQKQILIFLFLGLVILLIPLLLWKWQTNYWLVYSYQNEGFNFFNPEVWKFLFSFEKGWLLWSPLILVSLILITLDAKRNFKLLLSFFLPLFLCIYVFSSWWCWTYGTGFGQRPLIEFIPFLLLLLFVFSDYWKKVFVLAAFPLVILSMIQAYQTYNGILPSAEVTSSLYWQNFGKMKTIAPKVELDESYVLKNEYIITPNQTLGGVLHYSDVAEIAAEGENQVVVTVKVGAEFKNENIQLIVANKQDFYRNVFIGGVTYDKPRELSYSFDISNLDNKEFVTYVWNSDSDEYALVEKIEIKSYSKKQ